MPTWVVVLVLRNPVAENQQEQGRKQQRFRRHHEMAERHQQNADHRGLALAEIIVGDPAAQKRRGIDTKPV